MKEFVTGLLFMYVLAMPLLYAISEPTDEDADPYAVDRFALLWPITAIQIIYMSLRGDFKDDGE
tara:strand:- start:479 stop:670 length:192 start_codon:yes stop_codon:yes gene_type:complete